MIFNIPVGGKRKVVCTFLGAVGETLTFKQNGVTIATVTENTEVTIKQGVYDVTGSTSNYTKQITIKDAGEYKAYPDGALYWYGREIVPFAPGTCTDTTLVVARNTNSINIYSGPWTSTSAGIFCTVSAVDFSGYTKCKIVACHGKYNDKTWGGSVYAGIAAAPSLAYSNSGVPLSLKEDIVSTVTTKTEYTLNVSQLDSGYPCVATHEYNANGRCIDLYAVYLDEPKDYVETEGGTNTVALSDTLRYTSYDADRGWAAPGDFGQGENFFGLKTGDNGITSDCNTALIPVGSFNFSGKSTKLRIAFNGHRPSADFTTFRWAICTSSDNKALYQYTTNAVTDDTQIVSGTATLANYAAGANSDFAFDFVSDNIPAGTNLFVYLWPYARTGVAHISGNVTATIYYGVYE